LRDSKQPERSSALRSISNSAKERPIDGFGERVYESTKLAVLFDVLVDRGCPAGEILRNVNLTMDEVHSSKSRISLAELLTACKNAIRLSNEPHLNSSTFDSGTFQQWRRVGLVKPGTRSTMGCAPLGSAG
jgi:hypothetical protein